jgi:hypothetical protein
MSIAQCHREQELLDAVRSGRWSGPWGEELRRHAAVCPACAEVAIVAAALRSAYEDACAEVRLPSAGLVWWKAQLAARRAAEERAVQPIAWVERAARVAALFGALGLAVWQWPRIAGWWAAAHGYPSGPESMSGASAWLGRLFRSFAQGLGGQSSGFLLAATAGALLALMALTAYAVLREE